MAQPTHRGPVEIKGVTTRFNHTQNPRSRRCMACKEAVMLRAPYERVMRLNDDVEFYHPECFESEFGERGLYGE